MVAISNGKDIDPPKKHSPDHSTKKHSRSKESKMDKLVNHKQVKCWKCGGNHYLNNFPIINKKKDGIHKVSKASNKLENKTEERNDGLNNLHVELKGQATKSNMERSDGLGLENLT